MPQIAQLAKNFKVNCWLFIFFHIKPMIKKSYGPVKDGVLLDKYLTEESIEEDLIWAELLINSTIKYSKNESPIHLSFYSLAKNVRLFSSAFALNTILGFRSYISNEARYGEESFVTSTYGWKSWYPWIWIRNESNLLSSEHESAWNKYFEIPFEVYDESLIPKWKWRIERLKCLISLKKRHFVYLACLARVFKINEDSFEILSSNLPLNLDKYISTHIRRGEVVSKLNPEHTWPNLPKLSNQHYLSKITELSSYSQCFDVYISSDEEISFTSECSKIKIFELQTDRRKFYRLNTENIVDLDSVLGNRIDLIEFYANSSISDLYYLSRGHCFVGTISHSEFSRLGWELQAIHHKAFKPFIDLGGKAMNLGESRTMLLI